MCIFLVGDSISAVEYYDPIVSRWQVDEPMRTLRSRVGIAVLQGNGLTIYCCIFISFFFISSSICYCKYFSPVKLI